jgi:hypothetical protein
VKLTGLEADMTSESNGDVTELERLETDEPSESNEVTTTLERWFNQSKEEEPWTFGSRS